MDGLYYLDIDFTQEQEITPGTEDIEIPANRWIRPHGQNFDKGIIIKGDADLVPENIRSGVNIFGVAGAYGGKEIPDRCIVFLGGDGCLYVRKGSGVSVGGLDCNIDAGWGDWTAYGPFDQAGAFSGSVLSQNEVYLSWLGFTDFTKKWTLHTLVSGYPATEAYWPAYHPRFAWGFDTRENGYEDNYSISDLPVYVYGERSVQSGTGVTLWDGAGSNGNIPAAGLHPVGFTWDGPNSRAYWFNTHGGNVVKTTVYPYDEEMGMPGEKYTVGRRLFLGKPSTFTDNWNGNITTNSGMPIGGFALELNPEGYTDGASYISPLLDGTYKNL